MRTAHRTCGHLKGSPGHCHPSSRTLQEHVLHRLPLCGISALISLVGLISVHDKCSVKNFSTSGVTNNDLILKINERNRVCRKVKHKRLGVTNLPICQSTINKMKAPADSRRQAGVKLSAARLLVVVGNCSKLRKLRTTKGCTINLLDGCISTVGVRTRLIATGSQAGVTLWFYCGDIGCTFGAWGTPIFVLGGVCVLLFWSVGLWVYSHWQLAGRGRA